jgi:DNA-binding NarL/FixJ family response regulator
MINVLIIDDSALLRERLSRQCSAVSNVSVVGEAGDVQTALDRFHSSYPQAVVLDLQLPGGSGMDVLAAIKKARPETTVIVLTNFPLPQVRQRCTAAGADHFFDKSTEFDVVGRVLGDLVRQSTVIHQ